jgi:hypothetical protein
MIPHPISPATATTRPTHARVSAHHLTAAALTGTAPWGKWMAQRSLHLVHTGTSAMQRGHFSSRDRALYAIIVIVVVLTLAPVLVAAFAL